MDVCHTQSFNWLSVILNNEFILVCGNRTDVMQSQHRNKLIRRTHLMGRVIFNSVHCKSRRDNSARGSSTRLYTWTTSSATHPRRISSYWAGKTLARHREVCATLHTWRVLGVLYATKHSWLAWLRGAICHAFMWNMNLFTYGSVGMVNRYQTRSVLSL